VTGNVYDAYTKLTIGAMGKTQVTMNDQWNYPGSKGANGAWQKIISQIPKCDTFIEAMCGSAVVSKKIRNLPARTVINDIDMTVIARHVSEDLGIKGIDIENLDYKDLIDKYDCASSGRAVFYFDPPYLKETRSWKGDYYNYGWSKEDHDKFLSIATTVKSNCMISHYPCSFYDGRLPDWRKILFKSMTRAGLRTECLYMNYPYPVLLQDYKSVGENFTDRQRIKRKVERLINKLKKEQDEERSAILSSIIEHFSYMGSRRHE
jgi:hypothetical protein